MIREAVRSFTQRGTKHNLTASYPAWTTTNAKRSEPKGSTPTTRPCKPRLTLCAGNSSYLRELAVSVAVGIVKR
jgi:hypothetical protein